LLFVLTMMQELCFLRLSLLTGLQET
jgi:hypothetical protein